MSTANNGGDGLESYLARAGSSAAGTAPAGRLWHEGREVGEWTVAGFVGRGGSSEVYCARHRRLGTAAVLKVLFRDEEGPQARFLRETRFLMESGGGSFPAFYGAGEDDGRSWLAMELLEEYPLPSKDAPVADYLLDVARGVEKLHRRGWVHRDLKPRNILRRASDGHAVLIDFGLLKRAGEDAAAETAAGRVSPSVVDGHEVGVGTPGYAAPEQFAGGAATPATDVHALGMLADECFGGKPPLAWERIIRRATGSIPRQRYADAAAFARAIRHRHWPRNAAWLVLACALAVAATWWWQAAPKASQPSPPVASVPEEPSVPVVSENSEVSETSVVSEEPPLGPPLEPAKELEPETALPETTAVQETARASDADIAPELDVVPEPPAAQEPFATPEQVAPPSLSVRAARAAALARFEAEEWRKEAIFALVDDMHQIAPYYKYGHTLPTWCGRHEVTQKAWKALMDDNPSRFQGDDLPVDSLTMGACLEFLERLNATSVALETKRQYRLPSSWEWHQLADGVLPTTAKKRLAAGWFAENSGGRTHPGGEKSGPGPCADLFGNVRELTHSWGQEEDGSGGFSCEGGSWADSASEKIGSTVLEQPQFFLDFSESMPGKPPVPTLFPATTRSRFVPRLAKSVFGCGRMWRTLLPKRSLISARGGRSTTRRMLGESQMQMAGCGDRASLCSGACAHGAGGSPVHPAAREAAF